MTEHSGSPPVDVPAGPGQPGGDAPQAAPPSPSPSRSVRPTSVAIALAALAAALWLGAQVGKRSAGEGGEEAADAAGHAHRYYTCGMHPWVILPHPGPCPICGMPLVPLDPAKFSGEVTIDPVVVQNIGVRVAPVVRGPLVESIRTVGTIDYDETRVRDVNVKIAGWVQKLYVDALGEPVRRGDPLFELYSPDLVAAQQEYLLSRREGPPGGDGFAEAARTKLQYLDVPDGEMAALVKRGKPSKTITLRSPYTGVVIEKKTFEGMRLDPGMRVFRIADLSKVWVMVTLYEYQLPYVQVGQEATVSLPYAPGRELRGKVVYLYPYLDRKARQVQVRVEFDNPGLALKPGMYATVRIEGRLPDPRVLAPREAVIDTGERKVAFVSKGGGHFEPRQVRTGAETDGGMIEVTEGLEPGEEVVTSGQFLLDSEAKVREALAKMIRGDLAGSGPGAAAAPATLPAEARAALSATLVAYLNIQRALAAERLAEVPALARELSAAAERLVAMTIPGQPRFWDDNAGAELDHAARSLADARTLAEARATFAEISEAAARIARATGVPPGVGPVEELHCPMYREDAGGVRWLQPAGQVRNPYLGKAMLACFDRRATLPAAAADGAGHP